MENNGIINNKFKVLENYIGVQITYREICELVGWEYFTGGTSKKAQFKELDRHASYKTVGKGKGLKYMIIELYDEVLDKMDQRQIGNNTKYGMSIETTIMYVLNQHKNDHMYVSCGRALELARIVNDNYRAGRRDIALTSKALGVEESYIYNFYDSYNQQLIRIFERGLRYMRSRCCIMWNKVTIVARDKVKIKYNELNEPVVKNGKVVYDIKTVHTVATEDERRIITDAENEVLKSLKYKSLQHVFINKAWKTFKARVEAIVSDKANIKFYYEGYDIIINKKGVAYNVTMDQKEISECTTNDAIIDMLDTSIQEKANKLGIDGVDYVDSMDKLTNVLIKDNCQLDLSKEIDKLKNPPKKNDNATVEPQQTQLNISDDGLPF